MPWTLFDAHGLTLYAFFLSTVYSNPQNRLGEMIFSCNPIQIMLLYIRIGIATDHIIGIM